MALSPATAAIFGGLLPGAFASFVSAVLGHDCTSDVVTLSISFVLPFCTYWGTSFLLGLPINASLHYGASVVVHDFFFFSRLPRLVPYSHIYIFLLLSVYPSLSPLFAPLGCDAQSYPTAPPAT